MNGDMTSDQQSQTAQRQLCPYCGRPFKRLKTHLPHCKMAPVAKKPDSCTTSSSPHGGALLEHTATMGQTVTTALERLPDLTLPKDARPSLKAKSPKVRTDKEACRKKSEKSSASNGSLKVMDSERGKGGMEAVSPDWKNSLGDNRNLLRSAHRGKEVSGKAADGPRGTQTKAKPKEKDAKNKTKQTVARDFPPSSSKPNVVETERKCRATQTEPHARSHASSVLGSEGPSGSHSSVGGDAEGTGALKTSDRLVTTDLGRGALNVEPAVLGIKPLDPSALATKSALLHKPRPLPAVANMCEGPMPKVSSLPACTQTPPLNPSKAPAGPQRGPGKRWSCPAGLEWTPELALAYRGIGFSMVPRLPSRTEHVQKYSPQNQPVAAEIKGCLAERAFMDVRLAELPSWLMSRPLPTPRVGMAYLQRGWKWYYSRYIDVRKGGVSGVAMLLTSYCVLSYVWSYPRLMEERWRKYH